MKLARIEHWRCGEPMYWKSGGGYTYVWVDDAMTHDELEALVNQAQKDYLDMEHQMKTTAPVNPPGYGPTIHNGTADDKTVGQLRAEYFEAEKAYKAYQKTVEQSRRPFAYWLEQRGNGRIKQFHQQPADLQVELSWGHNHGVTIEHSPTKIADYPFPEENEEDYV